MKKEDKREATLLSAFEWAQESEKTKSKLDAAMRFERKKLASRLSSHGNVVYMSHEQIPFYLLIQILSNASVHTLWVMAAPQDVVDKKQSTLFMMYYLRSSAFDLKYSQLCLEAQQAIEKVTQNQEQDSGFLWGLYRCSVHLSQDFLMYFNLV